MRWTNSGASSPAQHLLGPISLTMIGQLSRFTRATCSQSPGVCGHEHLDLSKHLMYDCYYNHLKAQYGESCQLLYMDTDSLLLEIETGDVYKDMIQNQTLYDTSDYPQDHPLYSSANKKVLGKLKNECAVRAIAEYVGLRPKMYSILEAGGKKHQEGEGCKKECREEAHQHEQYKEALFEK